MAVTGGGAVEVEFDGFPLLASAFLDHGRAFGDEPLEAGLLFKQGAFRF